MQLQSTNKGFSVSLIAATLHARADIKVHGGPKCSVQAPLKLVLLTADAIARHHGSQCGFCTPGMVVACHAALSKHEDKGSAPSAEQMEKALDGNLCRCTGYRPILDACKVHSPALRHFTSAEFGLLHVLAVL